jgi:hypothetical protein
MVPVHMMPQPLPKFHSDLLFPSVGRSKRIRERYKPSVLAASGLIRPSLRAQEPTG